MQPQVAGCTQHPLHDPQCPLIQMTDTDVTLLPNYNNMDLARLHVIILTSVCVFITAGPIIKLCAGGEGDSEGHVL
jgi:hypothetical protein